MSVAEADIAFVTELFSPIPDLTTRKMFGGLGIYSGGTIFALLMSDGRVMIKAQEGDFADRIADMGGVRWTYTRKDGAASSMPYYTLPDAALDDADMACDLARDALKELE